MFAFGSCIAMTSGGVGERVKRLEYERRVFVFHVMIFSGRMSVWC